MIAAVMAAAAVLVAGWRGAIGLQRWSVRRHADRRRRHFSWRRGTPAPGEEDVAEWCERTARSLRSGSSLTMAIAESTADHPSLAATFDPIILNLDRGRSLVEAIELRRAGAGPSADPSTAVGFSLGVLRACADLGGPAAAPLERAAAALRGRAAIAEEQHVHSAQARMSAQVLTLVPVGLLVVLVAADADVRAALGSTSGLAAVSVGAVLNGVGWLWMQRIVGRWR